MPFHSSSPWLLNTIPKRICNGINPVLQIEIVRLWEFASCITPGRLAPTVALLFQCDVEICLEWSVIAPLAEGKLRHRTVQLFATFLTGSCEYTGCRDWLSWPWSSLLHLSCTVCLLEGSLLSFQTREQPLDRLEFLTHMPLSSALSRQSSDVINHCSVFTSAVNPRPKQRQTPWGQKL